MTIIGLLIGGVLKGQELLENARVTATIAQIRSYEAALTTFQDKYDAMPGDIREPQQRIPGCAPPRNAGPCQGGDGDSHIGVITPGFNPLMNSQVFAGNSGTIAIEPQMFWQHLALSDLISGIEPGASEVDTDAAYGVTHPAAPIGGGFHIAYWPTNGGVIVSATPGITADYDSVESGHYLVLRNSLYGLEGDVAAGLEKSMAISPQRAYQIDRKLDNGRANSGNIWFVGTYCASGTVDATGAEITNMAPYMQDNVCMLFAKIGP